MCSLCWNWPALTPPQLVSLSSPIRASWAWWFLWSCCYPMVWCYTLSGPTLQRIATKLSPPAVPTSLWWSSFLLLYSSFTLDQELLSVQFSSVQFSSSVVSDSLGPHELQHARPATTLPEDKVFPLFYPIIAPMFNHLIYTLRNIEMKNAIKKLWCHITVRNEMN